MAPNGNESTLFSSLLKEISNIQEHIWSSSSIQQKESDEVDKESNDNNNITYSNDNNNSNDNKEEKSEKSFWQRTSELMEKMEQEMQNVTEDKDVKFISREDSEDQVELNFELIGLTCEEIKISMTSTNILEIELLSKNDGEGPSCIWAYPLEQELKVNEMRQNFTNEKLVVTMPKDPNFNEAEVEEGHNEENNEEIENRDWICPLSFWPFAMTPAFEDDSDQTIQAIEANIEESEENFKIEMKIDGFKADEINIRLCQNHVLNVYGERKKNPENPNEENEHFRKSFGRVFWIPDGCKKEEITAKTKMEDSILILEISVPKGGESSSEDNEEMREIYIQQI